MDPSQAGLAAIGAGLAVGLAGIGAGLGEQAIGAAAVGAMAEEDTCDGKNISPALSWTGVPKDTKNIVLIMDDPDTTFVHWVLFNIPVIKNRLSVAISKNGILNDGGIQGTNDFGYVGYGGPCPPSGKPHKYYFRIYALDKILDLSPGISRKDVDNAMKGHILAKGELFGIYGG